jgi:hypothetical protein
VRWTLFCLLATAAACSRQPKPPVDPELAARLPSNAAMVAGIDVDALRNTPLFAKLPDSFREASAVLAAFDPPNLVTVARVGGRVTVTGPASNGPPPDLIRHATTGAPIWVVARGNAALPLAGNLANLNRLLEQTDYTRVTARVGERVEFEAAGVCRSDAAAEHLEQNIRAIASLARLTVEVRRDGATVHVTGSAAIDTVARIF